MNRRLSAMRSLMMAALLAAVLSGCRDRGGEEQPAGQFTPFAETVTAGAPTNQAPGEDTEVAASPEGATADTPPGAEAPTTAPTTSAPSRTSRSCRSP